MFHIESDWSAVYAELDRIGDQPDLKMKAALDAALAIAFASTEAVVHVKTGSLKTSGKNRSKTIKYRHAWEGVIEYGGASAGANDPVDYAIYEKERDGAHDFFAPLNLMRPVFLAAIRKGLKKGV